MPRIGDILYVALVIPAARHPASLFLVERYLPVTNFEELSAAVQRVAQACSNRRTAGVDVRYLHSIYIPAEDTCFCVFQAVSAEDVRDANDTPNFRIDRISAGFGLETNVGHPAPIRRRPLRQLRKRLQ